MGVDNLARVPTPAEIGQALRESRRAHGWSQERLASEAGVHRVTVATIETAAKEPTSRVLFAVLVAVGVALFLGHLNRIVGESMAA